MESALKTYLGKLTIEQLESRPEEHVRAFHASMVASALKNTILATAIDVQETITAHYIKPHPIPAKNMKIATHKVTGARATIERMARAQRLRDGVDLVNRRIQKVMDDYNANPSASSRLKNAMAQGSISIHFNSVDLYGFR